MNGVGKARYLFLNNTMNEIISILINEAMPGYAMEKVSGNFPKSVSLQEGRIV